MEGYLYFEIQVENAERARTFYGEVFGWTFEFAPGMPVPYWRIETGAGRGGVLERPTKTPPAECGTNAFVCSFQVDDLDAVGAKIIGLGGRVALPKFAVPSVCWHAYFIDPEGNTFGVYQVDVNAG